MLVLAVECTENLLKAVRLVVVFVQLIQIAIPIGLIVMGTIDLAKAVMSSDEAKIKNGYKMLVNRIIAAIVVFLIVIIVKFVTGLVGSDEWQTCWNSAVAAEK